MEIEWLDASEATGPLNRDHFDTPVQSVGYFLGVKGKRARHLVIAKEIINKAEAFHYNCIPVRMIEGVSILAKDRLDRETKRALKKFVRVTITKLRKKDGWVYAERSDKKRVH